MNPSLAIALKVASTVAFTSMLACVKLLSTSIPQGQIVFSRSFFALIPIVVMLAWQGQLPAALRTKHPWVHASRGLVGMISMAFGFASLAVLPLPESMMIGYAQPLLIVVLASIVLKERVRMFRWTAVCIGFVGIIVILWPRLTLLRGGDYTDAALIGACFALMGALFSAFAGIFIRSMTQTESTGTIVFYFAVTGSVLGLMTLPFGWVVPSPGDAAVLLLCGLLGGVGQILMTSAYKYAGASTIAPFEYVSILWGLAFGYVLFSEVPHTTVFLGGAIVMGAGIVIILRERQLGIQRARQRKAMPPPPA